jgi:hypothetical protein
MGPLRWWNRGGSGLLFATGAKAAAIEGDDLSMMDEAINNRDRGGRVTEDDAPKISTGLGTSPGFCVADRL